MTASPYGGPSMVEQAYAVLAAFGGRMPRSKAHRALRYWKHYRQLTPAERLAIVNRFPAGAR